MYKRYRKIFQTKVVGFEEGHKKVPLVALLRSSQSHFEFFKWNLLAFTAHYYSLS